MLTIFFDKEDKRRFDDVLQICYDNEGIKKITIKDFFEKELDHLIDIGEEIYIPNLSFWAMLIIKKFQEKGLVDMTKSILESEGDVKLEKGCFSYILSADNGVFYSIQADKGDRKLKFYEFKNLVAVDINQLMEEFGGSEVVAMHRAIMSIRGLGTRCSTISSAAYALWKRDYGRADFRKLFKEKDPESEKLMRDAYHGGLCFLNGSYGDKIENGLVLDINSLYAYVMKSCRFPTGSPHHGYGEVPEFAKLGNTTYYVRFRCSFKVKKDHIPFARTRCDKRHWIQEKLSDSYYRDLDGVIYDKYEEVDEDTGEIFVKPLTVTLCMYKPEYELFKDFYDIENLEELEYVWYYTSAGVFDRYVDRFYDMKKNAKTKGERRLAKMFLNALTGRMAYKIERQSAIVNERSIEMLCNPKNRKEKVKGRKATDYVGDSIYDYFADTIDVTTNGCSHIEIGAAITSEAMCYLLRKAQANYKFFKYTDTDSLHLSCGLKDLKDIEISDELGAFKVEHEIKSGIYYKEKVNFIKDKNYSCNLTFAGLPKDCQRVIELIFERSQGTCSEENLQKELKEIYGSNLGFVSSVLKKCFSYETLLTLDIDRLKIPRIRYYIADYNTYTVKLRAEYYKVDIFN